METCNVTVRHGGKLTSSVRRRNVTPAEAVLLKKLHAEDALVDYALNAEPVDRSDIEELERLRDFYGVSAENLKIIDAAFPGHSPKLPATFAEIGVSITTVEPKRRKRTVVETADAAESVLA